MGFHRRKVAARLWPKYVRELDALNRNARLKNWHREHLHGPHFADRIGLHRYVREQLDEPIDYLEFGVFEGKSLRLWTELCRAPDSRLFGFDTFTGLPEKWELGARSMEKGFFGVDHPPRFDDPRVTLIQGLFQDTLPAFLDDYRRGPRMVIHCDADLYSSTLYVLTRLAEHLRPGDDVIFDEFSQPLHEFRALEDWTAAYRIHYRGLASSGEYHRQVAIQIA